MYDVSSELNAFRSRDTLPGRSDVVLGTQTEPANPLISRLLRAASTDYVKFQAVIKSAASAASLRGGRASGRLDHGLFVQFLAALATKKYQKIIKISDSDFQFFRAWMGAVGIGRL